MGERGSLRAYAKHRGVTLSSVQKARDTGRIPRPGDDGKLDFEAADRQWAASTDLSKPRNSITGQPKGRKAAGGPGAPMGATGVGAAAGGADRGNGEGMPDFVATYGNAKAVRETYNAKLAQLDYETRKGLLVDLEGMKRAAFACSRRGRDGVLSFPDRCAQRCDMKSAEEVFTIIEREARKLVEEMARGVPAVTVADLELWIDEIRRATE